MDIRSLRYFLAIAEHKSFTRAADRIGVTQPALSRQMNLLEEELNVSLFDRHSTGVQLTPAGSVLRERALEILREIKQLRHMMIAASKNLAGNVSIGMLPSARSLITIPLLQRCADALPEVFLSVVEESSQVLRTQVLEGTVDLAVMVAAETTNSMVVTPLTTMPMKLVGLRENLPNGARSVGPEEVASVPLLLTVYRETQRVFVERYLRACDAHPKVAYQSSNFDLIEEMIAAGLGFSVLPECLAAEIEQRHPEIGSAPLRDFSVDWVMVRSKEFPPSQAAKQVSQFICDLSKTA